jgi:hypothetical protein
LTVDDRPLRNENEDHMKEQETLEDRRHNLAASDDVKLLSMAPVNVQLGGGATPAKVALLRNGEPVKVQLGGGATPAKVALLRSRPH